MHQDALRGPYLAYALVGVRPCMQLASRPFETNTEAGARTQLAARFVMRLDRFTRDIAPRWRISVDAQLYDVIGVERDPAGGSVIVWAEARTT